jgi:hypothetical protein
VNLALLIAVGGAIFFFRVADYEHLSPWVWVLASVGLSAALGARGASTAVLILAQVALFGALWAYKVHRLGR